MDCAAATQSGVLREPGGPPQSPLQDVPTLHSQHPRHYSHWNGQRIKRTLFGSIHLCKRINLYCGGIPPGTSLQRTSLQIGLNNWQSTYYHSMPTTTLANTTFACPASGGRYPLPKAWSHPQRPPQRSPQSYRTTGSRQSLETMIEKAGWLPVNDRKRILYAAESGRLPKSANNYPNDISRTKPTGAYKLASATLSLSSTSLPSFCPLFAISILKADSPDSILTTLSFRYLSYSYPLDPHCHHPYTGIHPQSLLPTILRVIPILRGYVDTGHGKLLRSPRQRMGSWHPATRSMATSHRSFPIQIPPRQQPKDPNHP